MDEDERLKAEPGSLHVEIGNDEVKLRSYSMELALEGIGAALTDESIVSRASMIYNFIRDGKLPEVESPQSPRIN